MVKLLRATAVHVLSSGTCMTRILAGQKTATQGAMQNPVFTASVWFNRLTSCSASLGCASTGPM